MLPGGILAAVWEGWALLYSCFLLPLAENGRTTADMANGPVQRVQPYPETITLLVSLGAINNNNCASC